MRSVLVNGEVGGDDLGGLFSAVGADAQGAVAYAFGPVRVVVLVGRKFFFRSNDYLGLVIVATTDGREQRIDISYAGGGSGLLGVQWGAGSDLESQLYTEVVGLVQRRSLSCSDAPAPG
ncbi:MAG TPA: hypothetical protein VMG99_01145 [Thermoplasmata archaeon]|jgi:hypothetical protein|nr:hypothetical protein [Thermoplasmata archaeon]